MKERRDNESNRVMMKNAIKALFSSSSTVSSIMHHIADTKVISSQQISSILFRANLFFSNTSWCQAKTMNLFSFLFATASIFLISTVFFPCFINFFLLFVNSYKEEKFILKKNAGFFGTCPMLCWCSQFHTHMRWWFFYVFIKKRKKSLFPFQTRISDCSLRAGVKIWFSTIYIYHVD